jgi:hypothetical protein
LGRKFGEDRAHQRAKPTFARFPVILRPRSPL